MTITTVHLVVVIEGEAADPAIDYAIGLCEAESSHLRVDIVVPMFDIRSGRIIPVVQALAAQVNDERRSAADAVRARVETNARLAGVPTESRVLQGRITELCSEVGRAARPSDIVVISKANGMLTTAQGVLEALLFHSGRPTIVVPLGWSRGAKFDRIVVAWDGGEKAARAVGDAMPFLEASQLLEILCVSGETQKSVAGGDLAQHLTRRCKKVVVTERQLDSWDAGQVVIDHLSTVTPDIMIMGAYAHNRVWELLLGGVTATMLEGAKVPVLYSH